MSQESLRALLAEREREIVELKAENEFIATEVYKDAVAEGIHDKVNDLEVKTREQSALLDELMIINSIPSKIHLTLVRERLNEEETLTVYVNGMKNLEGTFGIHNNVSISEWLEIPRKGKG